MVMTRPRLPRHAWIGLLLMALGVVILLIAFLWVATTWLLAVGTLASGGVSWSSFLSLSRSRPSS
jgi:hypothetical protein